MDMLTAPSDAAEGWTLLQALELTADPLAWKGWLDAKNAFDKARIPIHSSPGSFITKPAAAIAEHRKTALRAFDNLKQDFVQFLSKGALVATGSRGARTVAPAVIYRDGWTSLIIENFEKSILRERGPTKIKIYNVRIFPLVHAENAAAQLSDLSFIEAFRRCVLADPEVIALSKRIEGPYKYKDVFQEGQFPGPVVDFKWPLHCSARDMAEEFVRPVILLDWPEPSPSIRQAATALHDRWSRLVRRLTDGELVARGTYVRTGTVQYISPLQWARQGLCVDVRNGDLLEEEQNRPVLRWSGLEVVSKPNSGLQTEFEGQPTPSAGAKQARRRPVAEAVAQALAKHGYGESPASLTIKEIASLISQDMPRPPKTQADLLALSKAVERYYNDRS